MTATLANPQDWTQGQAALRYQQCEACEAIWYFNRDFCPQCGSRQVRACMASGRGMVHAVSVVRRAPSRDLQDQVPYTLVLVDAQEGFRLMAHGDAGLTIGDAVQVEFRRFAGSLIPHFRSSVSS